ncbi:MAG: hypothetical protein ABW167_13805 [Baekduia sp.]
MLKMVSKKSMLLLGAVMALCAFVLPSVASAASWTPVNTTDGRIDSSDVGFSITATGSGSRCTSSTFSVSVDSSSVATITGGSFNNCHGNLGSGVGCTTTATLTNLPWRVTVPDTSDVIIHGVDIDVSFETTPGTLNECSNNGLNIRLFGSVTASYTSVGKIFNFRAGPAGSFTATLPPPFGNQAASALGSATATGLLNVVM